MVAMIQDQTLLRESRYFEITAYKTYHLETVGKLKFCQKFLSYLLHDRELFLINQNEKIQKEKKNLRREIKLMQKNVMSIWWSQT